MLYKIKEQLRLVQKEFLQHICLFDISIDNNQNTACSGKRKTCAIGKDVKIVKYAATATTSILQYSLKNVLNNFSFDKKYEEIEADSGLVKLVVMTNVFFNNQQHKIKTKRFIFVKQIKSSFFSNNGNQCFYSQYMQNVKTGFY